MYPWPVSCCAAVCCILFFSLELISSRSLMRELQGDDFIDTV